MAHVPFKKVKLCEDDVSGSRLPGPPASCSAGTLRKFIQSRGVPATGLKKQQLSDLAAQISNAKISIDADKCRILQTKEKAQRAIDLNAASSSLSLFPVVGWKSFPSREIPKDFDFEALFTFIKTSAVLVDSDGELEQSTDYGTKKPLARGRQYFKSGHVTEMKDATDSGGRYCLKANVKSSMKDTSYTVIVVIDSAGQVHDAECHCRGSALKRCSHVAAVLIALEDYVSSFGYAPVACTSLMCTWNRGGKDKRPDPVYLFKYQDVRDPSRAVNFDTRVKTETKEVHNALLKMTIDKTVFPNGSKWETILDFFYDDYTVDDARRSILSELVERFLNNLCFEFKSATEVPNTKDQGGSAVWRRLRGMYITASEARRVYGIREDGIAKWIREHLWYPTTFHSKFTDWGANNEKKAREEYILKKGNKVLMSGLWINPKYKGLAASPDGIVFCEQTRTWGVLEIKCPYTLKDYLPTVFETVLTPQQLRAFCLSKDGDTINLKRNHDYFFQVQMQMGLVGVEWCDFTIWTTKGLWIQRIYLDRAFWEEVSQQLMMFHRKYIAVEYFEMRIPRKLSPLASVLNYS